MRLPRNKYGLSEGLLAPGSTSGPTPFLHLPFYFVLSDGSASLNIPQALIEVVAKVELVDEFTEIDIVGQLVDDRPSLVFRCHGRQCLHIHLILLESILLLYAGSMSAQLRPIFTSTFNGTSSLREAGMTSFTRPRSSSSSECGPSKISSSWTCSSMRVVSLRFESSSSRRIIAILMMSD